MVQMSRFMQCILITIAVVCLNANLFAAPAPAGQLCPDGAHVIGFDSSANIICSGTCGNNVLDPGETCDDGNTASGDACPASCQSEKADAAAADKEIVVQTSPAPAVSSPSTHPPIATIVDQPVVSRIKPWKLTYGSREVTITVTGTGFNAETTIVFQGTKYATKVNQEGTILIATLPTRNLDFGAYAITVSNGPGMETIQKKALQIY